MFGILPLRVRLVSLQGVRKIRGSRPNALKHWAILKVTSGRASRIVGLPKAADGRRAVRPD